MLDAFGQFQEMLPALSAAAADPEPSNLGAAASGDADAQDPDNASDVPDAAATDQDQPPLPVFLKSKAVPRGNPVIALGIAVWAKRYQGVNEIDAETAKGYWRDSGRKIPANINRDLGNAASSGWLERLPGNKGQFRVTSFGEGHFDELPAA